MTQKTVKEVLNVISESKSETLLLGKSFFPIVGIGASAGGLAAFEAFFSGMPADVDPNMAFVLVQHLAPDHKSLLTELVQRYTRMQVFEVEDGMPVKINCVYIIPPNHDMALLNGCLQLLEPIEPRGQRMAVDFFFKSLALDQHQHAIAIVLSGSGSDGTAGVQAIKAAGGMIMAQDPESTEFEGMPSSAMATGSVDYVVLPQDMPLKLMAYVKSAFGKLPRIEKRIEVLNDSDLKKIFILLRAQTTHDFSHYKPNTINRRIERRMAVQHIESLTEYVKFLQQTPNEVEALFRDLLIGVTSFFRDKDVYAYMQDHIIPQLLDNKPLGGTIRVWSAGCSTGEEAYSMAILLQERMELMKQNYTLQVFATDLDSRAIVTARAGIYPASIAENISPERLARFFTLEPNGTHYRIHKIIRDMLIFSEQDVIKDPPFSRIDLICCRNLLIYLGSELQKKLIPLFHYALNVQGILLLGTSEGVGEYSDIFKVLDRKAKVFQRIEIFQHIQFANKNSYLAPITSQPLVTTNKEFRYMHKTPSPIKLPLRELTEKTLLEQIAPAAALVNAQGDILYLHGRTGMFLELTPGEVGINNIIKMAREGLRPNLHTALHKVVQTKEIVHIPHLSVKTNGHFTLVNLTVRPVLNHKMVTLDTTIETANESAADLPLFLIVLEEVPDTDAVYLDKLSTHSDNTKGEILKGVTVVNERIVNERIAALLQELRNKDEYLQSTHEELDSSNEELKSSNEEMQSVNEELQSTNEEMETSKEELQSVNEELATVNAELHAKLTDLSRVNNDMNNLLAGTGIATIFVDHQMRILRFTPTATQLINLIPSDLGRPVGHIVSNLVNYNQLVDDIRSVLDTLIVKEIDVQSTAGKWFTMRIRPYRTLENVIEGVVITFIDISEMNFVKDALHKANEYVRLAVVVRDANDAITVQDLDGRITAWNPGAERLYGWSEAEALKINVKDRIPKTLQKEALVEVHNLSKSAILQPYKTQRITKTGEVLDVWMTATALVNESGQMYAIATTERAST